jgi:hypothetical protein
MKHSFKQTCLDPDGEGRVFIFCGQRHSMTELSEAVRALVDSEMEKQPGKDFLTNTFKALRGSEEIAHSRNNSDHMLYRLAQRHENELKG